MCATICSGTRVVVDGKRGTDRTGRHRQLTVGVGQEERLVRKNRDECVGSGTMPFIVTVQTVVLPPMTGLGAQVNPITVA